MFYLLFPFSSSNVGNNWKRQKVIKYKDATPETTRELLVQTDCMIRNKTFSNKQQGVRELQGVREQQGVMEPPVVMELQGVRELHCAREL